MRKFLVIAIAVVSVLSFAGCSNAENANDDPANTVANTTSGKAEESNNGGEDKPELSVLGALPDNATFKMGSFEYSGESIDTLCQKLKDYLGDQYKEIREDGDWYFDVKGTTGDGYIAVRVFDEVKADGGTLENCRRVVIRNSAYSNQKDFEGYFSEDDSYIPNYSIANVTPEYDFKAVGKSWGDEDASSFQNEWYSAGYDTAVAGTATAGCYVNFYGSNTNKAEITWIVVNN